MPNIDGDFWPFNFDQIEDQTRKNYYALLPEEATLKKELAQLLVINKPAGAVGGDGNGHIKKVIFCFWLCMTVWDKGTWRV